jgi:hypothetical protein
MQIHVYRQMLNSNAFFEDKSSDFVTTVAPFLKGINFDMNEVVYMQGDYANEMYFIVHG